MQLKLVRSKIKKPLTISLLIGRVTFRICRWNSSESTSLVWSFLLSVMDKKNVGRVLPEVCSQTQNRAGQRENKRARDREGTEAGWYDLHFKKSGLFVNPSGL